MFGNNFGLFKNPKKAKKLLKKLHKITSPKAYKTKDPAHILYH